MVGQNGSLYRYGGEEFIVLLEGAAAVGGGDLAERMRSAVGRDVVAGLPLTLSVGVANATPRARDCPALVAAADRALYRAKASGRDRVCLAEPGDHHVAPITTSGDTSLPVDRRLRSPTAAVGIPAAAGAGTAERDEPRPRWPTRARNWVTYTAAEREHMLDVIEREAKIGKVVHPITLAALVGSAAWMGWAPLIPAIVSVTVMQLIHLLWMPRVQRPEYPEQGGILLVMLGSGLAIVLAHHPLVALPLLTIVIFPGAAMAPARTATAKTLIAGGAMAAAALLVGAHQLAGNPSILVWPLALLTAVAIFGYAIGQSTTSHRALATIDLLTGTLTRAALRSRVAELSHPSEAISEPLALLVADLDHFKAINDEHGHTTGDRVLAEVAARLRAGMRAFDSVYRIGGEEFVMLLIGVDERDAVVTAERVRNAIRGQPVAGLAVTVSVGVAGCAAGSRFDYERLFEAADAALLVAKAEGRDRVLTSPPPAREAVAA